MKWYPVSLNGAWFHALSSFTSIGEWKNMDFRVKVGPKDKVTLWIWLENFDPNAKQYLCALPFNLKFLRPSPFNPNIFLSSCYLSWSSIPLEKSQFTMCGSFFSNSRFFKFCFVAFLFLFSWSVFRFPKLLPMVVLLKPNWFWTRLPKRPWGLFMVICMLKLIINQLYGSIIMLTSYGT